MFWGDRAWLGSAVALRGGIWVFLSQGCAWDLPLWVSASDTQTQTKPQAPAPNRCLFNSGGGQGGRCVLLGRRRLWRFAAWWGPTGGTSTAGRDGVGGEELSKGLPAFPPAFCGGCEVPFCRLLTYLSGFSKEIVPRGPLKGGLRRAAPALYHQAFPRKVQSQRKKSASTSAVFDLYNTTATPRSPCSYYSLVRFMAALGLQWKEREASGGPTRASTHKNVCFRETFGIFFLFSEPVQRNLPCPFPQERGPEVTTS